MTTWTHGGRPVRLLCIIDEYTRESLAIHMERSIGAQVMIETLADVMLMRGVWDYVIVHELLHFSVPNHGKLWKSLMRAHLGEYEVHEGALKRIAGSRALQKVR